VGEGGFEAAMRRGRKGGEDRSMGRQPGQFLGGPGPGCPYTIKKVDNFPIPSRDVANQTLPGRENC
jgi:hypothetical protein